MATYYETARTNYFTVKDVDKFNEWLANFSEIDAHFNEAAKKFCLLFDDGSGIPLYRYDDDGEEIEIDFVNELSTHLQDNSIAIIIGIGQEKMRYLAGFSTAVNSKGETVSINLNDIYKLALEKFGNVNEITAAEY